jgi:hypothetical protein
MKKYTVLAHKLYFPPITPPKVFDKIRNYINEYDSIGETLEFGFPHHIKNRIRQRFIDKKKLPNILNMVGTFVQVQPQVSDEIV